MPARIDFAAVKHGNAPPTAYRRAMPPCTLPAVGARCPRYAYRVIHGLPFAATIPRPVIKSHPVGVRAHIDGCDLFTVARPLPAECLPRCQSACPRNSANVQDVHIARGSFPALPAAAKPAHISPQLKRFIEIINQIHCPVSPRNRCKAAPWLGFRWFPRV